MMFPCEESEILAVFKKCEIIEGQSPLFFRKDAHGCLINYKAYGTKSLHGWEIVPIPPAVDNGTFDVEKLQALHIQ